MAARIFTSGLILMVYIGMVHAEVRTVPKNYSTIQAAIEASVDGDTVLVAPGHYYENLDFLGKSITVRGLDPHDPATVANTIVDANGAGSVICFHNEETENAVLAGFTLTGGVGRVRDGEDFYDERRYGGGIYCYHASPTIRHNVITGNHIPDELVVIDPDGTTATRRGRGSATAMRVQVEGTGGGIYCYLSAATLYDNRIYNNRAHTGGGLYIYGESGLSAPAVPSCGPTDDEVNEGLCTLPHFGGHISNNHIHDNQALRYGGAYIRGTSLSVNGNLIHNNHAEDNGGLSVHSLKQLSNNTIVNNSSTWEWSRNLYVWANEESFTMLINNNILGSTLSEPGVEVHGEKGSYVFAYNAIWGLGNHYRYYYDRSSETAIGNIFTDPLFVDPNGRDFHLLPESPCVSAGDPDSSPYEGQVDIDGENRLFAQRIDIGADECHGHVPPLSVCEEDQHVLFPGDLVQLDGSASYFHPEGSAQDYQWKQLEGPEIQLTNPETATPSFVPENEGDYVFELTTHDGTYSGRPDQIKVVVGNTAPVAVASDRILGVVNRSVVLDGSDSYDRDPQENITYTWTQVEGPTVDLVDANSSQASFSCEALGTYVFALTVHDQLASSSPLHVTVETIAMESKINDMVMPGNGNKSSQEIDASGYRVVHSAGPACWLTYNIYYVDLQTNKKLTLKADGADMLPQIDGNRIVWVAGKSTFGIYAYDLNEQKQFKLATFAPENYYYGQQDIALARNRVFWFDRQEDPNRGYTTCLMAMDIRDLRNPQTYMVAEDVGWVYGDDCLAADGNTVIWNSGLDIFAADVSDINNPKIFPVTNSFNTKEGIALCDNTVVWSDKGADSGDIWGADIANPNDIRIFPIAQGARKQSDPTIYGHAVVYVHNNGELKAKWLTDDCLAVDMPLATGRLRGEQLLGHSPVLTGDVLAWIDFEQHPQAVSLGVTCTDPDGNTQTITTGVSVDPVDDITPPPPGRNDRRRN